MKKLLLAAALLLALNTHGQKIKLKKNAVYLDKEQVATFDGAASALKGEVKFEVKSLKGEPMFTLKHINFKQENYDLESMRFQQITFHPSGKIVRYSLDRPYYGDKKVFELFLEKSGTEIFRNNTELAFQNDESEEIVQDSTAIGNLKDRISETLTQLSQGSYNKNYDLSFKSKRVKPIRKTVEGQHTVFQLTSAYNIYRDGIEIGFVTKEKDVRDANAKAVRYTIYRKTNKPFDFNGKEVDHIMAGCAVFDGPEDMFPILNTFEDNEKHRFNSGVNPPKLSNLTSAEKELVVFMWENGYL